MSGSLYTTIRNTSGAKLFCQFIGRSGTTLAVNQEVSLFGSVVDVLREGAFSYGSHIAPRRSNLEKLLSDGKIAIISTPAAIVKDGSNGNSYALGSDSGSSDLAQVYPTTTAGS